MREQPASPEGETRPAAAPEPFEEGLSLAQKTKDQKKWKRQRAKANKASKFDQLPKFPPEAPVTRVVTTGPFGQQPTAREKEPQAWVRKTPWRRSAFREGKGSSKGNSKGKNKGKRRGKKGGKR